MPDHVMPRKMAPAVERALLEVLGWRERRLVGLESQQRNAVAGDAMACS